MGMKVTNTSERAVSMTDKLEEIRKRWAKATPGPWRRVKQEPCAAVAVDHWDIYVDGSDGPFCVADAVIEHEPDAAAIAGAPEDVAWLVAEVKRLRNKVQLERTIGDRRTRSMVAAQSEVERLRERAEAAEKVLESFGKDV